MRTGVRACGSQTGGGIRCSTGLCWARGTPGPSSTRTMSIPSTVCCVPCFRRPSAATRRRAPSRSPRLMTTPTSTATTACAGCAA
ncbi:MAG: hypothetical protein IKT00_00760 [Prevotella sp.]|nr:hypothetical protein [Prevotella sp.]